MDREDRQPGAIIIGGTFSSLGAVRNLAKHSVPVCVLDSQACVAQFSRYTKYFLKYPSTDGEAGLVRFLLCIAAERNMNGWVVFPSGDEHVRILAQHRQCLSEHYLVTTPCWDVVKFLYDKRLTYRLALQQRVPVPETHFPGSRNDLAALNLDFPVLLKPAISTHFSSVTKKKAYRADNIRELDHLYERMAAILDPCEIMVQELIPGRGQNLFSFVGFFKGGRTVAGFSARRLRQHPMELGRASTFVETVSIPELGTLALRLLDAIAYSGLAEVEFMYDPRHARFELLEVNPRIWGWHSIAARAGLDLPYLAYADAIGREVAVGIAREHVKWVRLLTDVPTAALEILAGRLTVREYWASLRGDTELSVLSLSDPLPCLAELLLVPQYLMQRGF